MSNQRKKHTKAEKRKMEQIRIKKRNRNIMIGGAFIILIIVAAVYAISVGSPDDEKSEFSPVSDSYEISATQISIPVSTISNDASYYNYDSNGVNIQYFAVKGEDEKIHVALDSCDVCYMDKEGYQQIGDVMQCRNCGLTFPIEDIGEKNTGGGCWPSFIPITIENGDVLIEKSDLDDKRYMFE